MAKQTPTYTEQVRLEDIVKESSKEPCEWALTWETAWGRNLVPMFTPD